MGEYARSLAIARAVNQRWPDAQIHFVLSREAPYAALPPFQATLLASSPTFHSAAVIKLLQTMRPDIVVFDNAGRTAQLRAARQLGARIVYISARARQRRKAFRVGWMGLIDEHWIAYPKFVAGPLSLVERLKLKMLKGPMVRYLDVILTPAEPQRRDAILMRAGCQAGAYVLMVPGGGTGHPGVADAASRFVGAARRLAQGGASIVFVGPWAGEPAPNLHPVGFIPQAELGELMRSARLIIANGGSTLLQAIACAKACVAVPIAKDQLQRIRCCVAAGVAVAAALDVDSIAQAAAGLLQNQPQRSGLERRAAELKLADGVGVAVQALAQWVT